MSPPTLEMKPLEMIAQLKREKMSLEKHNEFLQQKLNDEARKRIEIEYENKLLKERCEKLSRNTTHIEYVDLASDNDDNNEKEISVPQTPTVNRKQKKSLPISKVLHKCNQCSKRYTRAQNLATHMLKSHNVATNEQSARNSKYKCTEAKCKFSTVHLPSLKRHRLMHMMVLIECPKKGCQYRTPYEKRILNHVLKVHKIEMENFRDAQIMKCSQ